MELKIDIFLKIALGIVFVAIIAKIGAVYFFQFMDRLSGTKRNSKDHDIDAMIEAKKQMIRTGEYGAFLASPPPLPTDAIKPKVESLFRSLLDSSQTSEEKKQELKRILLFFEEATWGGGKSFDHLKQTFQEETGLTLDTAVFVKAFRFASARQLFHERQSENDIKKIILASAFIQKILAEALERQGTLIRLMSQREHLLPFHVVRGVELLFLKEKKQDEAHLYTFLLQSKETTPSELSHFSSDEKDRLCERILLQKTNTLSELYKKIISEANTFASLTPLIPSKDLLQAYANLGVTENHSDEEIKRAYRKMAMERHPDRLSGKKIPKNYQDIAHKNFHIIHDSLELISAHRKKNA